MEEAGDEVKRLDRLLQRLRNINGRLPDSNGAVAVEQKPPVRELNGKSHSQVVREELVKAPTPQLVKEADTKFASSPPAQSCVDASEDELALRETTSSVKLQANFRGFLARKRGRLLTDRRKQLDRNEEIARMRAEWEGRNVSIKKENVPKSRSSTSWHSPSQTSRQKTQGKPKLQRSASMPMEASHSVTMQCRKCGSWLMKDAVFCRKCSTRVEGREEDVKWDAFCRADLEAETFCGQDDVDTAFTDFDLVFKFKNPGHVDEVSSLVRGRTPTGSLGPYALPEGSESTRGRGESNFLMAFEKDISKEEMQFKRDLIDRQHTRHSGSGPRVMIRCSSCHAPCPHEIGKKVFCRLCNAPAEELLKQCGKCSKKVHYDMETCPYCRSKDLREKVFPMVSNPEDLKPEEISFYVRDLIKDFFIDPGQGERVNISQDISSLSDARRAIVDIFLSFFRGQEEEHYFTYLFKSVDFDELFLCVKMTDTTARRHAEAEQLYCTLDFEQMKRPLDEGGMHIKYERELPEFFCFNALNTRLAAWWRNTFDRAENFVPPEMQGGITRYHHHPGLLPLLAKYPEETDPNLSSLFTKCDRIRLLYDRVTDVMEVQDMIKWGFLIDFFPLHTKEALTQLKYSWARVGLAYKYTQPINDIKNYFGPHIALYFVFLEAFLKYSIILVVLSLVFFTVDLVAELVKHGKLFDALSFFGGKAGVPQLRIVWALIVVLWCTFFEIRLKRNVATKLNIWGLDKEDHSTVKAELNPRFASHASIIESELNENELDFDVEPERRSRGRFMSRIITVLYVCVGLCCTVGILRLQTWTVTNGKGVAQYMSFALTIEIKIVNGVWSYLGQWLVDHEYWKERTHYDNSMAYKNFWVQWIATFASFYWIAFVMENLGDTSYEKYGKNEDGKPSDTPWQYLTYQMFFCFGLYLVFSVYDLLSPLFTLYFARMAERKALAEIGEENWQYSFIEGQGSMIEYDGDLQNDDYMQILLPFGFVLYFGATLPISAGFCWIYTAVQLRVDAWKLCHTMRRPYPRTTRPGAWVWEDLIGVFLRLAAYTNIALVSFVLQPIRKQPLSTRVAIFFALLALVNLINSVVSLIYPKESEAVLLAKKRHEYQREAASKMFAEDGKKDHYLRLRANKDLMFDAAVGRCRKSGYRSKNHDTDIDRSLVDKIFEAEVPLTFWSAEEP